MRVSGNGVCDFLEINRKQQPVKMKKPRDKALFVGLSWKGKLEAIIMLPSNVSEKITRSKDSRGLDKNEPVYRTSQSRQNPRTRSMGRNSFTGLFERPDNETPPKKSLRIVRKQKSFIRLSWTIQGTRTVS